MSYSNKYFQLGLFDNQSVKNSSEIIQIPDQSKMFKDLAMYIYALDVEKEETEYIKLIEKYASGEIEVPSNKLDYYQWEYHQMRANYLNHIREGWTICQK